MDNLTAFGLGMALMAVIVIAIVAVIGLVKAMKLKKELAVITANIDFTTADIRKRINEVESDVYRRIDEVEGEITRRVDEEVRAIYQQISDNHNATVRLMDDVRNSIDVREMRLNEKFNEYLSNWQKNLLVDIDGKMDSKLIKFENRMANGILEKTGSGTKTQ